MAFQSFIEDRGFDPLQVADETEKILRRSSNIIEQNQAYSEINYKQQANLINNLKLQRQREAQANTENHQLTLDGLRAAEAVRQQQAEVDLDYAQRKKAAAVQREQKIIDGITKTVGAVSQFAKVKADEIQDNYQKEYQQKKAEVIADPAKFQKQALALGVKLDSVNLAEQSQAVNAVTMSLMSPRSAFDKLLVSDSALQANALDLQVKEFHKKLTVGGGIDNLINTQPNTTISYLSNSEEKTVRLADINSLPNQVEQRQAYNALYESQISQAIGAANPEVLATVTAGWNNWLNTKFVAQNRKRATDNLRLRSDQRRAKALESGIDGYQFLKNGPTLEPGRTMGQGWGELIQDFTYTANPRQYFEELGSKPEFSAPGVTIGRKDPETGRYVNPHYNRMHERLIQFERQQSAITADNDRINGIKLARQAGEISVKDGSFSEAELKQSISRSQEMVEEGLMSGAAFSHFKNGISSYYNDFSDRKSALKQLQEDASNYQLDKDRIRDLQNKGTINTDTAVKYLAMADKQALPDEPGAYGYGADDMYKRFLTMTKTKVGFQNFGGPGYHQSAVDAAIGAVADYKNEVKLLLAQGKTLAEAQPIAAKNVESAIDTAKEGTKYQVTNENLSQGQKPFYNRYTPGNHENAYSATQTNLNSADIGRRVGNQPEILKDDNFKDLNGHLINIARQIQKGEPVRLSKFAEDTWKASGLDFEEFWNPLLNRESSPYKGLKVTPGSYGAVQKEVQKKNPELATFFNNLTTERKNILLEQTNSNIISSDIGQGRPFFFGAQSSVKRMGIAKGNENIVAAIAYIKTDGGSRSPESLPELYKSIEEEYGLQNYQPPEALIASLPPAIQRDVSEILNLTNSSSMQHLPGMSSNNVRIASTARTTNIRNEVFRGASELGVDPALLVMVMNFESGGNLLSGNNRNGLDTYGGDGGKYLGWIQFSPENQAKYGVKSGMNAKQMMDAVVSYLRDAGIRPGDSLATIYQAIQAPAYVDQVRKSGVNVGADSNGTISSHLQRIQREHTALANQFLRAK